MINVIYLLLQTDLLYSILILLDGESQVLMPKIFFMSVHLIAKKAQDLLFLFLETLCRLGEWMIRKNFI